MSVSPQTVELPPEPLGWTLDLANTDRLHAVAAFGFTDRKARFLLEVLLHSGVFLERQYCQFADRTVPELEVASQRRSAGRRCSRQ